MRRRSLPVVVLEALDALGPWRLVPTAALAGGAWLAALGVRLDDLPATSGGLAVAALAAVVLLVVEVLLRRPRRTAPVPVRAQSAPAPVPVLPEPRSAEELVHAR